MRQAPLHFAKLCEREKKPDLIFCTSMFNLCEFKGLSPEYGKLPSVMYFHENQLTYPVENDSQRDYHLAFSQFSAALVADCVLFNSKHHLGEYLEALQAWMKRMPSPSLMSSFEQLREKCEVHYPGIELVTDTLQKSNEACLNLLWSARWEKDKHPDLFLDLLEILEEQKFPFRVWITGCSEDVVRADLSKRKIHDSRFEAIGFVTRDKLLEFFRLADVFVSTAHHEYFGLSALQAAASGCALLLPKRCAYPEIYRDRYNSVAYHDDTIETMLQHLRRFLTFKQRGTLIDQALVALTEKFETNRLTQNMDQKFCKLIE